MKTIRAVSVAGVAVLMSGIFLGLTFLSRAQMQFISGGAVLSGGQPDSVVQIAAESQGLALVPPDQLPKAGTFWTVDGNGLFPVPYPCPPDDPNAIYYALGPAGVFLVDATDGAVPPMSRMQAVRGVNASSFVQGQLDSVLNLIAQQQAAQLDAALGQGQSQTMALGGSSPLDSGNGSDGGGTNTNSDPSYAGPDYGTNLWMGLNGTASNLLTRILSNSVADVPFELQTNSGLTSSNWLSAGFVYGSEVTNWTAWSLPMSSTGNLFVRVRSWASSDGSGLPIWWQLQYFGYVGVDPYGNPMGDG